MPTPCIDPQARICLLRYLHALHHGLEGKPCHSCPPAAGTVAILRAEDAHKITADTAAPSPADQPVQVQPEPQPTPHLEGLDLDTLREVLKPVVQRQTTTRQKSVYLERLQTGYNATALKEARIIGKKRFREALESIACLNVQGSWLILDKGAWSFCFGDEGPEQ